MKLHFSNDWLRKKLADSPDEPEGCAKCGAIAGACKDYPNCPGNEGSEVTTPTIRWTSHAMYLSDQGNGDSCWVLYGDYVKLQDVTIAAQNTAMDAMNRVLAAQAALIAFSEQVAKCNFVDDHGHPPDDKCPRTSVPKRFCSCLDCKP